MKWILSILLLVSLSSIGQTEDSTKYIWYKFQYGSRMPRFWADSAQHIPYGDTALFAKPQVPGFIMMHTDKNVYRWDGIGWMAMGAPTITNATATGDTLLTADNKLKRIDTDATITRSTNATKTLLGVDTISHVSTPAKLRDTAAALRASMASERFYGTIYNKSTWSDLSDFTDATGGSSVSSGDINLAGGSSATDYTKTLDLNYHTAIDRWKAYARFTVSDKDANSHGIGIGLNATSSWSGHTHDVVAKIDLTDGGSSGLLTINNNNGSGSYTTLATSSALSFSAGNVISISIERKEDSLFAQARNITAGTVVSLVYRYSTTSAAIPMPNTSKFAVYSFGGTQVIDSISITSKAIKNAAALVLGDSKAYYFAGNYKSLFGARLDREMVSTEISGGPGERTTDAIDRLPEIKALSPKTVLIQTFRNDPASGMLQSETEDNIDRIIDSLEAWGIDYYLIPFSETSTDLSAYNNYFQTAYPNKYINTWSLTGMLSDGVHPNATMHDTLAKVIINSFKVGGGNNRLTQYNTLQAVTDLNNVTTNPITMAGFTSNANSTINGTLTINPTTSTAATAIANTTGFLAYRATNSNAGAGAAAGVLTANDAGNGLLLYSGSSNNSFIANGTLVGSNGPGGLHLATISGADISFGGSFTKSGSDWARFVSGKLGIGTISPTAFLHLKAGTATANTAPIKLTAGTNLTTPEAGAVEFDGSNYYATASTTRYTLAKTLTNTATLDFPSTNAGNSSDLTITVTGAAVGDAVSLGVPGTPDANSCYTAWVSGSNTVTVRFNNYSAGAIDPASGTFRAAVIKY